MFSTGKPHFNSLKTSQVVKSRPALICREFTSTTVWQETQTSERWFSELQKYSAFPIRSAQDSRHRLSESSSSDLAETFSICMFFCVTPPQSLSFYSKERLMVKWKAGYRKRALQRYGECIVCAHVGEITHTLTYTSTDCIQRFECGFLSCVDAFPCPF